MASDLLYPYAYDEDLKTYLAPDDSRVQRYRTYKVGIQSVQLRTITGKRPHFWDPSGMGGGEGGGGPETAAHIFAKTFYQNRMFFSATLCKQLVLIRFEKCDIEQRLEERTPDLLATISECWPPFFKQGSKFILEIHAKNAIFQNTGRREALERIGVPCIEVDLPERAVNWQFNSKYDTQRERQLFEEYMTKILTAPFNVRWIVPTPPPTFDVSTEPISFIRQET